MEPFPHLRQPISLGGLSLPNRIMFTTHGPRLSQARYLRYLKERALGGVGLMGFNLGPLGLMQFPFGPGRPFLAHAGDLDAVPPHPLTSEGRLYYDSLIPAYRAWADTVHEHGARCIGQLYHAGAAQHSDNLQPVVAPSSVSDEYERHNPHALTGDEIADLVQAYAVCARRAVEAGYDGVEIHGAHGYLPHQFLSPLSNRRDDRYGGGLANRARFLIEVLRAVRDAVGKGFPIGVRVGVPDRGKDGLTLDDILAASRLLAGEGAGYLSFSGGSYAGLRQGASLPYVAPAFVPQGPNAPTAAAVKRAVDIPVIVAGRISDLDVAETIVAAGDADMVGMVRALIADPRALEKSFAGRAVSVIPCIGCNECHYGRPVACATNPASGREAEMEIVPAASPKRVLIIGAGPAGMECAGAAASRGHSVVLVDRRGELGGMLVPLSRVSHQAEHGKYLDYMRRRIGELGVETQLGVEADLAFASACGADIVVLATGAAFGGSIECDEPRRIFTAAQAMDDPDSLSRRVAVVGGLDDHLPPLLIAEYLAHAGRVVTLLSETIAPAPALEVASLVILMKRLLDAGVEIRQMTAAVALREGVLTTRNSITNAPGQIEQVDSIVMVGGRVPGVALASPLRSLRLPVHVIGDALSPRRMLHATLDGARLGLTI
jgi:2,4-dienoyl-CoA reductase-like NADH-dependent reductase (Old Yellow Enzyme family)